MKTAIIVILSLALGAFMGYRVGYNAGNLDGFVRGDYEGSRATFNLEHCGDVNGCNSKEDLPPLE
jgi:hypothetical protein